MHRVVFSASLLFLGLCLHAAEPKYLRDVVKWQEFGVPSESDQAARMVWFYAANYSKYEWRVFTKDGQPLAQLSSESPQNGSDHKIQTLLPNAPWTDLYPNSSVFSQNEQKLYIGMRQFVGEFSVTTKKLRLLIPSTQCLNKLPTEDEERIRKQYGG